jgi:glycosyltransferase involved in cell wall biosynthesis
MSRLTRTATADESADRPTESWYPSQDVAVVVPAYNEVDHVGEVLETVPPYVDRIYVVDDHSTDGTWTEIQRRVPGTDDSVDDDEAPTPAPPSVADGGPALDERIVPIRHDENRGAGAGVRTGYRHAHADDMDVTVTMDADGQMDPAQMCDLIDPIVAGEADYATGNRLATAADRREMPPFRLFGNRLLSALTKVASGYRRLADPQNDYTAISHDALDAVDVDAISADHDYTNDLLVRLNVADQRVADVPLPAVYGEEASTIDYASFAPKTAMTLLRGFCWRLERNYVAGGLHPLAACYGLAGAGALATVGRSLTVLRGEVDDGLGRVLGTAAVAVAFAVAAVGLDVRDNADREVRRE